MTEYSLLRSLRTLSSRSRYRREKRYRKKGAAMAPEEKYLWNKYLSFLLLFLFGAVGCDATRELVKAPFEATTALSNGTTQATNELLEPLKEFTSSTTPG